jgi:FMN phosphatase YigB (HAD superfamily)
VRTEAIILDLGGVLIDIDYQRTTEALSSIGGVNFDELFTQASQTELFSKYECGKLSTAAFREGLRSMMKLKPDDEAIDAAWNALIGRFSSDRLEFVRKLMEQVPVYLLSNINLLHEAEILRLHADIPMAMAYESLFTKVYFSHRIGLRKPDQAIFDWVLSDQGLSPETTVFVDDSIQHVQAAGKLGIRAFWLETDKGDTLERLADREFGFG